MPGGSMMGAPNALAGNFGINPGVSAYHSMNNKMMSAQLGGVNSEINEALRRQNQGLHEWMGSSNPVSASSGFGLTNLLSNMQFQLHKPRELMQGMEETQRYLGVGSIVGMDPGAASDRQIKINERARKLTAGVTKDFLTNMSDYQGFTGKEVGQISAELARTGQLDDSSIPKATESIKQMSKTIKSLQQFFKGGVGDLIDQINGLTGTDFQATFGSKAGRMLDRSAGVGFATGHTNQQMMALAGMSSRAAQQMGGDSWGSVANSQEIASMLGSARNSGTSSAFTNERRIRAGLVSGITAAQQSMTSRDLSGAYALLSGRGVGEDRINTFMDSLAGKGMDLNVDSITKALNEKFGGNVDASDIRNAASTNVGMEYRSSGRGTRAAFGAKMDMLNRVRRQSLRGILEKGGVSGVDKMLEDMGDNLGREQVRKALEAKALETKGLNSDHVNSMIGAYMAQGDLESNELLGMNAREADRVMSGYQNKAELSRISEQAGIRVNFAEMAQGMGTIGGLRSISKLADKRPDTFGDFLKTVMGDVDLDMGKLLGKDGKGGAFRYIEKMRGKKGAMAQLGMTRAFQAVSEGRIGNRAATEEEIKEAQQLISKAGADTKTSEAFAKFAQDKDEDTIEKIEVESRAADILKEHGMVDKVTGKQQGDARSRASVARSMEKMTGDYDFKSVLKKDGMSRAARISKFKEIAEARAEAAASIEKDNPELQGDMESFWKGRGEGDKKLFDDIMRSEGIANEGGVAQTNDILTSIFNLILRKAGEA
jgi:hypothetical protein